MVLNEQRLIAIVEPYFEKARAGDWSHALRVVTWVKELGKGRLDLPLLVTAAYIHDIGWSGIAPSGKLDLDEMIKLEPKANENSKRMIIEVLTRLNFTEAEIHVVSRLVAAADKHQSGTEDEAIIVDADNLSKLCLEHLQEKYQPESYAKLIDRWESELSSRIKTEEGRRLFPNLLAELKNKL